MVSLYSSISSARQATAHFAALRDTEPHPLFAAPDEVISFVRQLQGADRELASAQAADLPYPERALLLRRRKSAGVAIERQMGHLARRMSKARGESLETFGVLFRLGTAPGALDGLYSGQLITTTLFGPLDTYARFAEKLYMPWLGKRFDAGRDRGENIFRPSMRLWGRLLWPVYGAYRSHRNGLLTAFPFKTSIGPGALDPDRVVLKLDYDLPGNPSFIVRDVLDELVDLTANYYLGKAYIRRPDGHYRLAAYFALQKEEQYRS